MYLLLFKHLRAIVGIFAYWTRFRCVQFFAVITEVHGELGEVGGDEWIYGQQLLSLDSKSGLGRDGDTRRSQC